MTIKAGRETSEHARASRAEGAAFTVVAAGLVLAVLGALQGPIVASVGVLLVAIGAGLLASVNRSYLVGRSDVKAAHGRRPADTAPKRI
jgi:hypothetical protein